MSEQTTICVECGATVGVRDERCHACGYGGRRPFDPKACATCEGRGCFRSYSPGLSGEDWDDCEDCHGTGKRTHFCAEHGCAA